MPRLRAPNRDPEALLPLKPIELLVVTMLSAGERHGYGLRQDIVAHTNGRIALEAGNLYRHIRKLQSEGLVDETEPRLLSDDSDERRIYYRLLPFGRRVLAAEVQRLRALMRIAEANHVIAPLRPAPARA
ncbi:MAG TPA: PadR family transcriptional regulator [Gemmatimonadaceae bacterium]|nr:PadR family transcriptional regulator [Gemmatimonadaceae bacterium]